MDSYDFIDYDNNADPATGLNDHGTSCAGIVAMVRSNDVCGVGVAYDSNVAGIFNLFFLININFNELHEILQGIRLIGGDTVDSQEAGSLSHNRDNIHIYSNSWGPSDYGTVVLGPGPLLEQAFEEGVNEVSHRIIIKLKYLVSLIIMKSSWIGE